MDGEIAIQCGVESGPFFGFGPAFIADIALAIVGAPVPCSRHERSHNPAEHNCAQYYLHYGVMCKAVVLSAGHLNRSRVRTVVSTKLFTRKACSVA